jgi:hypothetical protein
MMTFSITDITVSFYCFLPGTIVTVANVGDSRVILGYQKDISPPGSSPRPKVRVTAPDSPGTSHEEISVHLKPKNGEDASARPEDSFGADGVEVDNRQWGIITTMPLSTDHKPDDPREAAVIIAAGKSPCHAVLFCLILSYLILSYLILFHLISLPSVLHMNMLHNAHASPFNHDPVFYDMTNIAPAIPYTALALTELLLSYCILELLLASVFHQLSCRAILSYISYSMFILQVDE